MEKFVALFGFGLAAVAGVRLIDIKWPPKYNSWPFYAIEFALGCALFIALH